MHARVLAAVLTGLLTLGACSSATDEGTKAGGSGPPLTLRIGADGDPSLPAGQAISALARYIEAESDGSLVLEPVWGPAGQDEPEWDQWLARAVRDDRLDLGVVPARAWDVEGVNSFVAMYAPFLVTRESVLRSISTGPLGEEMLSGLDTYGVTGLALVPQGMRYLFALGDPPRRPADLAGQTARAPLSRTTYALLTAIGMSPEPLVGAEFDRAYQDGSVTMVESAFAWSHTLPGHPTALGDLPLFPMADTIVVNTDLLESLSPDHRHILRAGALYARDWIIDNTPSERTAGEAHCGGFGSVVHLGAAAVREFQDAAQPVLDDLTADPQTAARIAAIEELAEDVPLKTPSACGTGSAPPTAPSPGGTAGATGSSSDVTVLDGTFRAPEWTVATLRDAGFSPEEANALVGVFEFTFDDGRFELRHHGRHGSGGCSGTYTVNNDELTVALTDPGPCGAVGHFLTATFEIAGDTMQLTDIAAVHPGDEILFGTYPWERVTG